MPTMNLQCTSQASSRRAAEKAAANDVLALIAEKMQSSGGVEPDTDQSNDTNKGSN